MSQEKENKETELSKAVRVLAYSLEKDPEFREAWKANIAMCVFDAAAADEEEEFYDQAIHRIANLGAERFLDMLIHVNNTTDEVRL